MTAQEDTALIAGQLAELTRTVEEMAGRERVRRSLQTVADLG
jgi:hypothetical protein